MHIIRHRYLIFTISAIVIALGLVVAIINTARGIGPFNLDVEFSGGTSMQIDIGKDFQNTEITDLIKEVTGQENPQVQRIINTNEVAVKMKSLDQTQRKALVDAFTQKYSLPEGAVSKISDVSATISSEMQGTAILAVVVSCVAMLVYVSIRFKDVRKGSGAILALLHDAVIVVLAYAVLRIPLNYSFIAAILTILGYSINSTIVIFDRVRENRKLDRKIDNEALLDKSINQTMTRTIYTTLTVFITITCLYIFGVDSIRDFALPIMIGVVCGAYSSVFFSGSIWYMLLPKGKKIV